MAPKRKTRAPPPRNFSHVQEDEEMWSQLVRKSIYRPSNFFNKNRERLVKRKEERTKLFDHFKNNFTLKRKRGNNREQTIIKCLLHWVKYESWNFCKKCFVLCTSSLRPQSFNSRGVKFSSQCHCEKGKYVVPQHDLIPPELCGLSREEEKILRVFQLNIGPKKVAPMGNRIKNGAFELEYLDDTVEDRIRSMTDDASQRRVKAAYDYLMHSPLSSYAKYVANQVQPGDNRKIKFWKVYNDLPAIECALWPVLYPYTSWCESILKTNAEGNSRLISFRLKLLSPICDYNNNFALLQFQFDRWLFKTITAAVSTGKKFKASPNRALETKIFAPEYWKWQHRYLIDASLQFGFPQFFITISPYEWDFPKPGWLTKVMEEENLIPTMCGAVETLHIAHVVEQFCKGYMMGRNCKDWGTHEFTHIFSDYKRKAVKNVLAGFFRFEYQNRRCIHVHILLWIKDVSALNFSLFSATVPEHDIDLAFLVDRIQPSDTSAPFLSISNEANHVEDGKLKLLHTEEDYNRNIRAYITTILPVLNSRMDVQMSDDNSALMKYVSSYVSKLTYSSETLRSTKTTPFQATIPFLIDLHPGEPEMSMVFSSTKISYCTHSRIKLVPPVSEEYFEKSLLFQKYLQRPSSAETLTCLEYCRTFSINQKVPVVLESETNLVGVKYKYIFSSQFFFQFTIVNTPFRNLTDLKHSRIEHMLPEYIPFSYMMNNHYDFLKDDKKITEFLTSLCYPSHKIQQFLSFKSGLVFTFLSSLNSSIEELDEVDVEKTSLSVEQKIIFNHIITCIDERCKHLAILNENLIQQEDVEAEEANYDWLVDSSDDDDDDSLNRLTTIEPDFNDQNFSSTSCKPVLILGKPGCGKSFIITNVVNYCLQNELSVLFACPTAYQAQQYLDLFPDEKNISADTIHSIFKIPINVTEEKVINWSLVSYDVIFIDEVGMVESENGKHILKTMSALPTSPILVFAGDEKQQQPLTSNNSQTEEGVSVLNDPSIIKLCDKFKLYKSYRSDCPFLDDILLEIRNNHPTKSTLNFFNTRAFCKQGEVTKETIQSVFQQFPHTTFLTLSRKDAHYINMALIEYLFGGKICIHNDANIDDDRTCELHIGMKVIITKNICKPLGLVNGAVGYIQNFVNGNIILKMKRKSILMPVHRIFDEEKNKYFFPILPHYAMTIFKCQGKTLPHVTIWLGNPNVKSSGAGYVAISRCKCHLNFRFLEEVNGAQIRPIKFLRD